jgi:hypothetical protein
LTCRFFHLQASVELDLIYVSPEDEGGNFEPTNLNKTVQEQYVRTQSIEEDQQALLDIEQNIANLEKSLNQGNGRRKPLKRLRFI